MWITLSRDLKLIYLDEDENLIFGEYYLEEVEETKTNENIQNEENAMSKLFEKLMLQQQNSDKENLQKISVKFILGKFSIKSSNVYQWVRKFENECKRFKIDQDRKKIEVLELFLEKSGLDWYDSMLIKLTTDSHWETWKTNFIETYANKGWSQIRYAMAFKYQTGSLLEYAVKKGRLLLEVTK